MRPVGHVMEAELHPLGRLAPFLAMQHLKQAPHLQPQGLAHSHGLGRPLEAPGSGMVKRGQDDGEVQPLQVDHAVPVEVLRAAVELLAGDFQTPPDATLDGLEESGGDGGVGRYGWPSPDLEWKFSIWGPG